jgi:DICT domain-containing protein
VYRVLAAISGQDFRDGEPRGMMFADGWFELFGDVGRESFFSSSAIVSAATCAFEDRSVSDDPLALVEGNAGSLAGSWHLVIISLIADAVTKSARPIRISVKRPRRASDRNVAGLMLPWKNLSQASFSVSAASSAIWSYRSVIIEASLSVP